MSTQGDPSSPIEANDGGARTSGDRSALPLLSCERCKSKKLRCSKDLPICNRCKEVDVECSYPARQAKSKNVFSRAAVIAQILTRLETVEKRLEIVTDRSPTRASKRDEYHSNVACHEQVIAAESLASDTENEAEVDGPDVLEQLVTEVAAETLQLVGDQPTEGTLDYEAALSPLSEALSSIRNVKLRPEKRNEDLKGLEPPRSLARKWIEDCYSHSWYDQFFSLVDKRLILALPDIIDAPEVKLDYSIMIIYYNALYCGWCDDPQSTTPELKHYGQKFYLQCLKLLPAWENDGKIEIADVVGLTLFTWTAIENFDYQLAYKLHVATCEVTRALGLHFMDMSSGESRFVNSLPSSKQTVAYKNNLRRTFWHIIHTEYFFRLHYDKPANISKSEYQVNLPQISLSTGTDANTDAIVFLISARLTLITKEFFDLLDGSGSNEAALEQRISQVRIQVTDLLTEWKVDEWLQRSGDWTFEKWLYSDVFIKGFLTIILTEKKLSSRFDKGTAPSHEAALAARKIMRTMLSCVGDECGKMPNSYSFISVYPFITFFTLYQHSLHRLCRPSRKGTMIDSTSTELMADASIEDDIVLMECLTFAFERMAQVQAEVQPVVNALTALNKLLRAMLNRRSMTTTPVSGPVQSPPGMRSGIGETMNANEQDVQPMAKRQRTSSTSAPREVASSQPQIRQSAKSPLLFDFAYIPSRAHLAGSDTFERGAARSGGISRLDPAQTTDSTKLSFTLDLAQLPPRQVEPQVLEYVDTIETDLFSRNWHESWWT